jgi:putative SOS response-associated peptidase YedK
MCGRYTVGDSHDLFRRFHITENSLEVADRFNVAPNQHMPVVIRETVNRLALMQWGLIPAWAKEPKASSGLINARIEGIQNKPTFRTPVRKFRCLVPCDGFYEWKKEKRGKTPYHICRKDRQLFALAGIYELWDAPSSEVVGGYSVLTTRPNELMEPIHNRMPVILDAGLEDAWLDIHGTDITKLLDQLEDPFPTELLEAYPVSIKVNTPISDSPELIQRIEF